MVKINEFNTYTPNFQIWKNVISLTKIEEGGERGREEGEEKE